MALLCSRPLAQPFSRAAPACSSSAAHAGSTCKQLGAAACRRHRVGGDAGRRPLAVEAKKRQQQRAQQSAAKQREQQVQSVDRGSGSGGGGASGGIGASSTAAPPPGYAFTAGTQQLDLGNIEKLEVRGNELVLTMRSLPDGSASASGSAIESMSSYEEEAVAIASVGAVPGLPPPFPFRLHHRCLCRPLCRTKHLASSASECRAAGGPTPPNPGAAACASLCLSSPAVQKQEEVMDAVVKIYCTHTEPNYSLPWQRKRQFSSTSSGFVVVGEEEDGQQQRYLLTNAHSVEYHAQVGLPGCWCWVLRAGCYHGGRLPFSISSC